ncbi:MAG TPA: hypothetical protein VLZ83_10320 [Edaphocola sp.]|nr:hypothetical protein [Edaphocola sp.]
MKYHFRKETTFYFHYYLNDGRIDTLEFGHLDGNQHVKSFFSTLLPSNKQFHITIKDDLPHMSSLSFQTLTLNTLNNNIKDGYLYIKFPDGITDSLRILVRNKESCS